VKPIEQVLAASSLKAQIRFQSIISGFSSSAASYTLGQEARAL